MFAVMAACPQHVFQVLTKRHGRMRALLRGKRFAQDVQVAYLTLPSGVPAVRGYQWPLPNVHLGVSAEDQHWAQIRVPALLDTPAAVRFVSAEPLIGFIDLTDLGGIDGLERDWIGGPGGGSGAPHPLLSWVIAGGESGAGARPCELPWLRFLRDQCEHAEVPFFCKQLGSVLGRQMGAGSKGGDWGAWPEDLRVREFPLAAEAVPR
jgi:protein gp37